MAVITFDTEARVIIPFTEGRDLQPRRFVPGGTTTMGAALNLAMDDVEAQKQAYRNADLEYYRPWLFVLTDGEPTDDSVFTSAAQRAARAERARRSRSSRSVSALTPNLVGCGHSQRTDPALDGDGVLC